MTSDGSFPFAGRLSIGTAIEKKSPEKRRRSTSFQTRRQLATASTDLERRMDEALEPLGAANVNVADRKVDDQETLVPGTKIYVSAELIREEGSSPETMLEQDDIYAAAHQSAADAEATSMSEPQRLFFLTNRMNLNCILSTLILAPRESYYKYYSDLLELSPGWVPLLTTRPPAQLVERVVTERGSGGPVLLELSESVLNGRATAGPVAYVRAVPLSDVVAIHFREESSLRAHRDRRYGNVHPFEDLLRVSPELFRSDSDAAFQIGGREGTPAVDWMQIDRVRGAVNGLLVAGDSGEGLAVAARLLGAPQVPEGTIFPRWLTWNALTGVALLPETESEAESADRLIFQTAFGILGERDQAEAWSPTEILNSVARDIAATHPVAGVQSLVDRNLNHIRSIVDVERDFDPFRNSRNHYVAAKSFLLVLLRPNLRQLLEWSGEETGADATTRTIAAVLAGRLRGLARESVDVRNLPMAQFTAAQAVHRANGIAVSHGETTFEADEKRTTLLLNGRKIKTATPLPHFRPPW